MLSVKRSLDSTDWDMGEEEAGAVGQPPQQCGGSPMRHLHKKMRIYHTPPSQARSLPTDSPFAAAAGASSPAARSFTASPARSERGEGSSAGAATGPAPAAMGTRLPGAARSASSPAAMGKGAGETGKENARQVSLKRVRRSLAGEHGGARDTLVVREEVPVPVPVVECNHEDGHGGALVNGERMFRAHEVEAIVRKAVDGREAELRLEYDAVLKERLEEQFAEFSAFTQHHIHKGMSEREFSYCS